MPIIAAYHRLFNNDEVNFLIDRGYIVMRHYIEKKTYIIDPYLYFESDKGEQMVGYEPTEKEKERKRNLEQEWIKAVAIIDGLAKKAIEEGKVATLKSSSQSDNIANNGWGDIEVVFSSGDKLKVHIELDFKAKHRTHRAKASK